MRAHTFTYILSLILLFCIPWGNMEVNAQRAQKRREGILTADSIRSQNRADSLALADTTNLHRQLALETLEAPIDTAALAKQNDSIQKNLPPTQEKKRWSRTDLQPEVLETTYHLWRFRRMCIRLDMERTDV